MSTSNFSHIYINGKIQPIYGITSSDFSPEDYNDSEVMKGLTELQKKEVFFELLSADINFMVKIVDIELSELNKNLNFFQIIIKSGYYDGFQLFIKDINDAENMNEKRQQNKELRKVLKLMRQVAKCYGLKCYTVAAKFSNGETWYDRKAVA